MPGKHEAPTGVERRALSLGTANAFDYALQFLLPVVLARTLDVESFGDYRLLWLAVGTYMAISSLAMPGSLYYFLPRSDAAGKRLYINQTLAFLTIGGLAGAWLLSPWNPWLPERLARLSDPALVVPAFAFLWAVSSVLDLLPTVDERVSWQSRCIVGLSVLRTLSLSAAAILTGDLHSVLLVLLAFVAFKAALLAAYIGRYHGLKSPLMQPRAFADQVKHAAPFGLSGALHGLRGQADQWVAAALFSVAQFASFSVAAVLLPMVNLFRQSVNHVFLPSMSRQHAAGDLAGMFALNSKANVMVGTLVYPLLALAFVFADEIVTVIYTGSYIEAAPAMRIYVIGMAAYVVELQSVMLLLRQGAFAMSVNLGLLVLSIALSWSGAQLLGLQGAALGSVFAVYVDRCFTLGRISRRTGLPVLRLQAWGELARIIALAGIAGVGAWAVTEEWLYAWPPLARLAAGAAVLLACYAALLAGSRRAGFPFARELAPQSVSPHPNPEGAPR